MADCGRCARGHTKLVFITCSMLNQIFTKGTRAPSTRQTNRKFISIIRLRTLSHRIWNWISPHTHSNTHAHIEPSSEMGSCPTSTASWASRHLLFIVTAEMFYVRLWKTKNLLENFGSRKSISDLRFISASNSHRKYAERWTRPCYTNNAPLERSARKKKGNTHPEIERTKATEKKKYEIKCLMCAVSHPMDLTRNTHTRRSKKMWKEKREISFCWWCNNTMMTVIV